MVLDALRGKVDPLLSKVAKMVIKINPDVLTWLALLSSIIAGILFYYSSETRGLYLPLSSLFVFINGLLDALDGKVAKMTKRSNSRGDFLDHALDRYADVFIVGGLSLSKWCDLRIGFFAVVGMLLTSYMGTQAQAVGYKRIYKGLLGRADRLALLTIIPVAQYILLQHNIVFILKLTLLEWLLVYIAVVGNLTAIQRFYYTLKMLKE